MKKTYLILGIGVAAITFSALSFQSNSETKTSNEAKCKAPDETIEVTSIQEHPLLKNKKPFHFEVDSRFATTITKRQLKNATSVFDIFPKHATEGIDALYNVKVVHLKNGEEITEKSKDAILNTSQKNLIAQLSHSSDFYLYGNFENKDKTTGEEYQDYITYYMTVIPEKEASYKGGHKQLMNYLISESKEVIKDVEKDKLQPGKIRFTIDANGNVNSSNLDNTSGYQKIDEKMLELIHSLPKKWNPAEDANGNKVSQQYVFSFGIVGC